MENSTNEALALMNEILNYRINLEERLVKININFRSVIQND